MASGIFVLIPIMVLGIAVAAIVSSSLLKLQRLRLQEAKLRAGDPGDMNDLVRQVSALQHELTEVQERLDFAERMLAQVSGIGLACPGAAAPLTALMIR
jgi:Tfp pilus assembly protein PilO